MMGPFAAVAALLLGLTLAPAEAACVRTGATVTCTGITNDGFVTRDTVDLTVVQGAFVLNTPIAEEFGSCPLSPPVISVGRNSSVTNRGLVDGFGTCGSGIVADDGSTVLNAARIDTFGNVAHGIDVGNGTTVTLSGEINTAGMVSYGIYAGETVRITTTNVSAIETSGIGSHGISAGNGASVEAGGSLRVFGQSANGIELAGSGRIVNSGSVLAVGTNGVGIHAIGANVSIANTNGIFAAPNLSTSTTTGAIGIDASGAQIDIQNTSTIIAQRYAIRLTPTVAGTVMNSGGLRALLPDTVAALASETTIGTEVEITNTGSIVGNLAISGGAGIERVTNSGFISGEVRLGAGNDSLALLSSIDGRIDMGDGVDSVSLLGSGQFSRPLVNAESMTKFNAGTWTVAAPVAVQTLNIIDGVMEVAAGAQISASTVNVLGTGSLTGAGAVAGLVRNEATVAPQATLTINGDYRQAATGTLRATLRTSGPAPLFVTGNATLAGTLDPGFVPGAIKGGEVFPLISFSTAQSTVDGQFARILGLTPFFLRGTTERSADGLLLRLRIDRVPFTAAAVSPRQTEVAAALDAARARGAAGLAATFAIIEPMTATQAASAFDSLAPAVPVAAAASAMLSQRTSLSAIAGALRGDDPAAGETRAWGRLSRHWGVSGGSDTAAKYAFEGRQIVAGFDHGLAGGARIGVAFSADDGDIAGRANNGTADSDVRGLSVYAAQAFGPWRLSGALGVGDGNTAWQRTGLFGPTTGKADLDLAGGFVAVDYPITAGAFTIAPRAALNVEHIRFGAARETAGSELVLTRQRETWLRPEAGVNLSSGTGAIRPYLSLAASYASKRPDLTLAAAFRSDPATAFALRGPGLKRWWLTTEAGAAFDIAPGLSAKIGFDGVINDPLAHRGVALGLSYVW